jgi:hypothetical protein
MPVSGSGLHLFIAVWNLTSGSRQFVFYTFSRRNVMKKVIMPLLLILSFSFLMAVESDPSAVVGYVKYDLAAGLNYVALPMDQGFTSASAFGTYAGATVVQKWDPVSESWDPVISELMPGWWDNDFTVGPGDALLINVAGEGALYSVGDLPAPATYSLVAGLNSLMIPLNRSDLTSASAAGTEMGATVVQAWDPTSESWDPVISELMPGWWDNDFAISIAKPLLVVVGTDSVWPAPSSPAPTRKAIISGSK